MTYLDLVNEVLARMRLDPLTTTAGVDDEAAKVIIKNVNDAKRKVEQAWRWTALREEWEIPLVAGTSRYALTDTYDQAIIDDVSLSDGFPLNTTNLKYLNRKKRMSPNVNSRPLDWAVVGMTASREIELEVWPTPTSNQTMYVSGWSNQPPLSGDSDLLKVPALPVIYEALAMSARERGEVGGQTALEIFGMAKRYLEDAVALDASLSPMDTDWVSV